MQDGSSPYCSLPADVLSLQSQDAMHQEIQHPEVPQDPGAPYPFVLINGVGGAAAGWQLFAGSPLLPTSLTCPPPDLKRFSEARIRASKLTTFVNFPLKDLDLREFASQSCSKRWGQGGRAPSSHVGATDPLPVPPDHAVYNLYAVSNHSGTTMGGHYTAYCKSPISSEWHSFNDSR